MAMEGPIPIIRGATPAIVAPQNLARIGWFIFWAVERFMRRMAAAGRGFRKGIWDESNSQAKLTSIGHLARVTTCALVAVGWERGADLAKRFESGSVTRSFIFSQCDFFLLAGLGVFDGSGEWYNLVVEPAGLLRSLRTLI